MAWEEPDRTRQASVGGRRWVEAVVPRFVQSLLLLEGNFLQGSKIWLRLTYGYLTGLISLFSFPTFCFGAKIAEPFQSCPRELCIMSFNLTPNTIMQMHKSDDTSHLKPVLQVLTLKAIPGSNGQPARNKLIVSDGVSFMNAMLGKPASFVTPVRACND